VVAGEFTGESAGGEWLSMACWWRRSWPSFCHCQIFEGQIYEFTLSSVGHAPRCLTRCQFLVLQPLFTVVRSLGGRRVVITRLDSFMCWATRDGYKLVVCRVWWCWWWLEAVGVWGLKGIFWWRLFRNTAYLLSFSCVVLFVVLWQFALCVY